MCSGHLDRVTVMAGLWLCMYQLVCVPAHLGCHSHFHCKMHNFPGAESAIEYLISTYLFTKEYSTPSILKDPCSLPDSSVHEILQARILEWIAISFFRASFWLKDGTWVSHIAGRFFTREATKRSPQINMLHIWLPPLTELSPLLPIWKTEISEEKNNDKNSCSSVTWETK